jgi:hypothetical protein
MDGYLRKLFFEHIEKIIETPKQRHLRFGVPFYVKEITNQARIVFNFENNDLYIVRCFTTHKEYEEWYSKYK